MGNITPTGGKHKPYIVPTQRELELTISRIKGDGLVVVRHSHMCALSQHNLVTCYKCMGKENTALRSTTITTITNPKGQDGQVETPVTS